LISQDDKRPITWMGLKFFIAKFKRSFVLGIVITKLGYSLSLEKSLIILSSNVSCFLEFYCY